MMDDLEELNEAYNLAATGADRPDSMLCGLCGEWHTKETGICDALKKLLADKGYL